jgi:hypothetical protein
MFNEYKKKELPIYNILEFPIQYLTQFLMFCSDMSSISKCVGIISVNRPSHVLRFPDII